MSQNLIKATDIPNSRIGAEIAAAEVASKEVIIMPATSLKKKNLINRSLKSISQCSEEIIEVVRKEAMTKLLFEAVKEAVTSNKTIEMAREEVMTKHQGNIEAVREEVTIERKGNIVEIIEAARQEVMTKDQGNIVEIIEAVREEVMTKDLGNIVEIIEAARETEMTK